MLFIKHVKSIEDAIVELTAITIFSFDSLAILYLLYKLFETMKFV